MRNIVQNGAAVLREKAAPVPEALFGTEELSLLIADMAEALDKESDGVALAAPQVGVSYRIFIVRRDRVVPIQNEGEADTAERAAIVDVYINPEIIKTSRRRARTDEGCLSVRGIYGTTLRHERATVRAHREDGSSFTRGGGGLLAQIFQHEIEHLDGTLFIDHAEHLVHVTEPAAE
jgi:peptide deformylase